MMPYQQDTFNHFSKKIWPYLDGSLRADERTEFEAFVATSAEFAKLLQTRQTELESLRQSIPWSEPDEETTNRLDAEMKEVVENLFRDENASMGGKVKSWLTNLF